MSANMSSSQPSSALPRGYRLDEYVIEGVLGLGGFGITYRARDTRLSAIVAIKEYFPQSIAARDKEHTIRPFRSGVDDFKWGLQEFLKEARALARFKHQHIVRVLRFVEANATAYMVMEYEEGESLDAYLRRSGGFLNEQMLLSIFIPVLNGLQAVHDTGLLHLDIKPDNIYLRTNGQPMLIDFGSARQAKGTGETAGKIALTPAYSAIEQYPGFGATGPWSDVYSMGATLYRCITGKAPVDSLKRNQDKKNNLVDPYVSAIEFERPFFSKHIRESVDLAMSLMPEARPQSAALLQKALMGQRVTLDDSRKIVRPSGNFRPDPGADAGSPMMVARKKKTRGFLEKLFFFALLAPALLVFGLKLMVQFDVISEPELYERIDALRAETGATVVRGVDGLDASLYEKWGIRIKPARQTTVRAAGIPATAVAAVADTIPPFSPEKTLVHTLKGHSSEIISLALLRNGDALASLDADGRLRLWDTVTGQSLHKPGSAAQVVGAIAGSPDGQRLAWSVGGEVRLYDLKTGSNIGKISDIDGNVYRLIWSRDGRLLAGVTDSKSVSVWRLPSGALAHRVKDLATDLKAITFSPNSRLLAMADARGEIRIIAATNGGEIAGFYGLREGEPIVALAYSPDGHWLAGSGPVGFLKLWDTGIDVNDKEIKGVSGALRALQFSPDSRWLVASDDAGTIQIWDIVGGKLIKRLEALHGQAQSLAISRNGQVIAAGGTDRHIRVWR